MDRSEALYFFWKSFGLPVYDEQTVPDDATMPYITYETAIGDIDQDIALTASIWYRSTLWDAITAKMEEINAALSYGGVNVAFDGGILWLRRGMPFAQRVADPNDFDVRRYFLNITANYISSK